MLRKSLLITLLCIAAGAGSATAGEVYKWTDAGGIVHYSDAPPPKEVNGAERVHVASGTTSSNEEPLPAPVAEDKKPVADAKPQAPEQLQDTPENRTKLCEQARANLELLQSKFAISAPIGADGKVQVMDDKTRQGRIANEQQTAATYCK